MIPNHKVNYTEIGILASCTKDEAQSGCLTIYKDLSAKVKRGGDVTLPIPNLGAFHHHNKVAAIGFINEVVGQAKGHTNKTHYVNKLFKSSVNKLELDIANKNLRFNWHNQPVKAKRLDPNAEQWMRNTFGVNS